MSESSGGARIGAEQAEESGELLDGGERLRGFRVGAMRLAVEEEPVFAERAPRGAAFDAREVDAARRELAEHLEQPTGAIAIEAEHDRRAIAAGARRILAREHDEARAIARL